MGVFSQLSWSLDFGAKMAEFPLPVLQIWRSRKRVAIQIQLMNIHVSQCKYYCLHLVPKFGDMCDRQNWRLHPTVNEAESPSVPLTIPVSVRVWYLELSGTPENPLALSIKAGHNPINVRITFGSNPDHIGGKHYFCLQKLPLNRSN